MSDQSSNPVSTHTHTLDVWNESSNSSNQTSPSPPSHLHDHHHEHHQDSPTPSNSQQQLPSNPSSSSPQTNFPPWLIIALWISISSAVIFYNALILRDWGFAYPITLTTLHLAFQTTATQLLARFTNLLAPQSSSTSRYVPLPTRSSAQSSPTSPPNSPAKETSPHSPTGPPISNLPSIDREVYWKKVVPIGVLFSISLVLSNAVYLYLSAFLANEDRVWVVWMARTFFGLVHAGVGWSSVAFIQMIKAASPVAVLLTSFAFGIHPPSLRLFGIVLLISLGIGIASYGELAFSLVGFLMQVVAIVVEANRVVLIQMLLGTGMSPLTSLYFFAPVCLAINASLILPLEGLDALRAIPHLGPWVILSNAMLTFLLNIAAVYLIQLSSLVLSLSKVGKDLILIFGSALILGGHPVSPLQWLGYLIALVGLVAYKRGI